jgi:hypothetical protein
MARIGIAITKSVAFRDSTQEFSNVYYYDGLTTQPNVTDAETLIDVVVTREKTWHSTAVSFIRGRLWSQVGTPSQNNMIAQKTLTGTGARTAAGIDKERAFLFRLRAGVDSRGNPVYLRKWFHTVGEFVAGQTIVGGVSENTTGFTQAQRDAQVAAMNSIGAISGGGHNGVLCAKSGRLPDAGALWTAHKYLEHHQLGDQWRAT